MKKYKLTEETKISSFSGLKVTRIEAVIDFGNVTKGDKGGWVEKEENLNNSSGNAEVSGNAGVRQCGGVRQCAGVRQN